MIDYVIYGRIIIDKIYLKNGTVVENLLGGGSPQAAFGARVWSKSVGILVRSGTDIPNEAEKTMYSLDIDTSGWVKYPDLPTTLSIPIQYDQNDYRIVDIPAEEKVERFYRRFGEFHSRLIPLPKMYKSPKVIHFLTDLPKEPMVNIALQLKEEGALLSLEPMIDYDTSTNVKDMLELIKMGDIVTPDWPSACKIANEGTPFKVMKHWIHLLSASSPQLIAIRHGSKGSYVWDRGSDQIWQVPVLNVHGVDSTGCGNSYGGGLCVGWEKYRDPRMAAACATVSAAIIFQHIGIPPMSEKIEKNAILWHDQVFDSTRLL